MRFPDFKPPTMSDKLNKIKERLAKIDEETKRLKLEERQEIAELKKKEKKERAHKLMTCAAYLLGDDYDYLYNAIKTKNDNAVVLQTKTKKYVSDYLVPKDTDIKV